MEQFKIQQNEAYFKRIINTLNEGGSFAFIAANQVYTKKKGKLTGSAEALLHIKDIVSKDFFENHFAIEAVKQ